MTYRIWIELDKPVGHLGLVTLEQRKRFADAQCRLANNMLQRLNNGVPLGDGFFVAMDPNRVRYCFGGPMGYEDLVDNGKWFNLEYFGRPLPKPEPIDFNDPDLGRLPD